MRDELLYLSRALDHPEHPMAAVVGGAKVSTKIDVLLNLLPKVDKLLIGGGMVYTFYVAMGYSVGDSLVERNHLQTAEHIIKLAETLQVQVVLATDSLASPITIAVHPRHALMSSVPASQEEAAAGAVKGGVPENVIVSGANNLTPGQPAPLPANGHEEVKHAAYADTSDQMTELMRVNTKVASNKAISDSWIGVDIGPETIAQFTAGLHGCKTVLWNGPMGICENPLYANGTIALMNALSALTAQGATTVVCGGETVAAVEQQLQLYPEQRDEEGRVIKAFTHVSTGGGAALEYLAGVVLPGVNALSDKDGTME